MAGILQQLEINNTFFVQFVLFAVFFVILSQLYLKPFQKLIEKRNHKLKNEVSGAAELLKSVESKLSEYEKALSAARIEARLASDRIVSEVKSKEEATMSAIREELKKDFLQKFIPQSSLKEEGRCLL